MRRWIERKTGLYFGYFRVKGGSDYYITFLIGNGRKTVDVEIGTRWTGSIYIGRLPR